MTAASAAAGGSMTSDAAASASAISADSAEVAAIAADTAAVDTTDYETLDAVTVEASMQHTGAEKSVYIPTKRQRNAS